MINATGLLRAPAPSWEITLKPVGMSRRVKRTSPEFVCRVSGEKEEAVSQAKKLASGSGFNNYAVSKITEIRQ